MKIVASRRVGKRLRAIFDDGKAVDFGSRGSRTYVDHGDADKRRAYLARHRAVPGEDHSKLKTPGALSAGILWGPSTSLRENIRRYNERLTR